MTADVGQMKTQFGDPANSSSLGNVRSSPYVGFALGGVVFGHSQRTHGVNFYGGIDIKFPTQTDGTNGNIVEFAGLAQLNYRHGPVSVGAGLEARDFSMPNATGFPDELLFGIPITGKVSFARGGHAFVQGGITPYVSNYAQTYVNGGSTGPSGLISTGTFNLGNSRSSYEGRIAGGRVFGHFGLRAGYIHRQVLFNTSGTSLPSSAYDFRQDLISGGVIFTLF